ncbi:MAG: DEAD/DEAH box helicase [Methanomicrobia archaeon]|nr:DEAD/DEAH box helicase [Methanomicrobia archaeon]
MSPPTVFTSFSNPIQKAIEEKGFSYPTEAQSGAIPPIMAGKNVLLIAPTATGKTESALLPVLDAVLKAEREPGIKMLYITPLKALNRDMLERLQWWCKRLDLRLGMRHGDTSTREREAQAMVPPDILITTPETLQAILPGRIMRQHLAAVKWVIVDEVHELAIDKRGSQLALALERLRYLKESDFQIIGLSATIGSPDKVAKFLVGTERECEIINVSVSRSIEVEVFYPKAESEDYKLADELYTYPEVAARLRLMKKLVEAHQSTLIFTNTRSITEILGSRFRVWDLNFLVGVHHGSLSKPSRITVERGIKEGTLHGIICTSSLELGIDIGRLDFVIQYNSPRQVTRLLQRIGRSGHQIGGIAHGAIVVQDSDDALEALVICRRALADDLEPADIPENPLDVLAHQIAGLLLTKRRWSFEEARNVIRKAYPYRNLEEGELIAVLSYMHSRIPRLLWFSEEDKVFLRPQRIKALYSYYFEHLSMIPEVRHYLVIDEDDTPVGVLDEAFVAEYAKPGNKFIEGGRAWKILHVYGERIYVKREEDPTGAIPSWAGEEIPVPYTIADEVGKIRGFVKREQEHGPSTEVDTLEKGLLTEYPGSQQTLTRALDEVIQQVKKGYPVPTDKLLTLERWNDQIILHCSFGLRANRTFAMLLASVLSDRLGVPVGVQQDPYRIQLKIEEPGLTPEDVREIVLDLAAKPVEPLALKALARSRLFKMRFIHVARRFGAIARDASLSDLDLDNVIRSFEGSAVFDEALREAQNKDVDIALTAQLLKRINAGKLELEVIKGDAVSPIAGIGDAIKHGYELIPPERMHRVILKYVKARLLDESLTFVCTNCWQYTAVRRINDVAVDNLKCPECESPLVGALKADESEVRRGMRQSKSSASAGKSKKTSKLVNDAQKSAELIATYGKAALIALAGKGLSVGDAEEILKKEHAVNEHLVELIIETEKDVLKRRFFRTKKREKK